MNIRTRRPPAWWAVVMALLATLWIAVTVVYRQGESGVRFGTGGAGISFERESDYALFAIDERAALLVSKDGNMSLVEYGRGAFPFCPLCGTHLGPARIARALLDRGWSDEEVADLFRGARIPPMQSFGDA